MKRDREGHYYHDYEDAESWEGPCPECGKTCTHTRQELFVTQDNNGDTQYWKSRETCACPHCGLNRQTESDFTR